MNTPSLPIGSCSSAETCDLTVRVGARVGGSLRKQAMPRPTRFSRGVLAFGFSLVAMVSSAGAWAGPPSASATRGASAQTRRAPVRRLNAAGRRWLRASDAERNASPQEAAVENVIETRGVLSAALSNDAVQAHVARGTEYTHVTSRARDHHADDVRNQRSSGTCWLHAHKNVVETAHYAQTHEMLDLSEAYHNRIAWGLRASAWLRHAVLEDRVDEVNDLSEGGWFHMAEHLHEQFGEVPEGVFSRTANTFDTSVVISQLRDKLVRAWVSAQGRGPRQRLQILRRFETEVNALLDTQFGHLDPRQLDADGRFEHVDPQGHSQRFTPREFAQDYVRYDSRRYALLSNYENLPKNSWVELSGGPGMPAGWAFNVDAETLKHSVAATIRSDNASWLTYQAGASNQSVVPNVAPRNDPRFKRVAGLMSTHLFDYRWVHGDAPLPKLVQQQAARTHESNHAVAANGVNEGPDHAIDGFLVQNSWGEGKLDHGFMHFRASGDPGTPEFFEQYVEHGSVLVSALPTSLQRAMRETPRVPNAHPIE